MIKRCYYVETSWDDESGIAVVESSVRRAKKLGYRYLAEYESDWLSIKARWQRNVNLDGLDLGHVFDDDEMIDGLFRGAYGWIGYATCPNCGAEDVRVQKVYEDVFGCEACEEKLTPKDINNPYKLKGNDTKERIE